MTVELSSTHAPPLIKQSTNQKRDLFILMIQNRFERCKTILNLWISKLQIKHCKIQDVHHSFIIHINVTVSAKWHNCSKSREWSVNNSDLPQRLRWARRAPSWPSLHVNELSSVRPQALVQTHSVMFWQGYVRKLWLEPWLTCRVKPKRNIL